MKTYTATPNGPANGKFQKKAVDSTGLPETSFSTPRNRLCTHIQCQCGRWLASASPVGCLCSNRDSWMRSFPLPDLLWMAWQPQQPPQLLFSHAVDPCHYIPKKSLLTCFSKYHLLKIKKRQTHELSKLATPNYMQLSTYLTKQELSG